MPVIQRWMSCTDAQRPSHLIWNISTPRFILERAELEGVLVRQPPDLTARHCNEKLFTAWFPECCAPSLSSVVIRHVCRAFLGEHHDIILKPLDAMGGASIFPGTRG